MPKKANTGIHKEKMIRDLLSSIKRKVEQFEKEDLKGFRLCPNSLFRKVTTMLEAAEILIESANVEF